jgi:nucleotide-binding universal stress UspA family protein
VRPGDGAADLNREPPAGPIVVPLDGGERAEKALGHAAELARLFDAEVALVRVNPPCVTAAYLPEGALGAVALEEAAEVERREAEVARRYLDGVAARLTAAQGARVRADVVVQEGTAAGILEEAAAPGAGLMVMETRGRRGLARLLLGSVADEVLRGGNVPVLLLHHGGGGTA